MAKFTRLLALLLPDAASAFVAAPLLARPAPAVHALRVAEGPVASVDWVQTAKYPAATAVQFGLIAAFFCLLRRNARACAARFASVWLFW